MKKHNSKMAQRWGGRARGDRSNMPQFFGHQLANDKKFQFAANGLLHSLLAELGFKRKVAA